MGSAGGNFIHNSRVWKSAVKGQLLTLATLLSSKVVAWQLGCATKEVLTKWAFKFMFGTPTPKILRVKTDVIKQ